MNDRPRWLLGRGFLTLLGLVAGALAGLLLAAWPTGGDAAVSVCQTVGRLWLSALQMTVLPLVASVLITGVADVADVAHTGRVAQRVLLLIVSLSLVASGIAVVIARFTLPLLPRPADLVAVMAGVGGAETPRPVPPDWLAIIPSNVVAAAAGGSIVPVVGFTLAFALALAQLDRRRRAPVLELAGGVAAAMSVLIGWILVVAPIGVCALAVPLAATGGSRAIGLLGGYIAVLVGAYVTVTALMYGVAWSSGRGLRRFIGACLPVQGVAAGTQSSLACLPVMLRAAGELNVPAAVSGFVLPLSVTLFRITSPVQYLVVAEFIAWSQGIDLGWQSLITLVPLAVVVSLGSVGLPGQASFMGTNLPVVQAAGLPLEPLGLLLAVDVIPDVAATVGNVTADLALTTIISGGDRAREASV